MKIIIIIAVLLIAIAFVAYVANAIYSAFDIRNERKKHDPADLLKVLAPAIFSFPPSKSTDYLVTKVWYVDGHKSSEVVTANSKADAFNKESDDKRNLEYYIESVVQF